MTNIKPYPVLLQFSALWCAPCKVMTPIAERIVSANATRLAYDKVDIDARPEMAQVHNVRSIPTFIIFKDVDGEWVEVDRLVGAKPEESMKAWVERNLDEIQEATVSTETI